MSDQEGKKTLLYHLKKCLGGAGSGSAAILIRNTMVKLIERDARYGIKTYDYKEMLENTKKWAKRNIRNAILQNQINNTKKYISEIDEKIGELKNNSRNSSAIEAKAKSIVKKQRKAYLKAAPKKHHVRSNAFTTAPQKSTKKPLTPVEREKLKIKAQIKAQIVKLKTERMKQTDNAKDLILNAPVTATIQSALPIVAGAKELRSSIDAMADKLKGELPGWKIKYNIKKKSPLAKLFKGKRKNSFTDEKNLFSRIYTATQNYVNNRDYSSLKELNECLDNVNTKIKKGKESSVKKLINLMDNVRLSVSELNKSIANITKPKKTAPPIPKRTY